MSVNDESTRPIFLTANQFCKPSCEFGLQAKIHHCKIQVNSSDVTPTGVQALQGLFLSKFVNWRFRRAVLLHRDVAKQASRGHSAAATLT